MLFRVAEQADFNSASPRLGFQAVILAPARWDAACICDPKRQPPQAGLCPENGKTGWFAWQPVTECFGLVCSRGREKSRKPPNFLLGAGGLAGRHSDASALMAVDDGRQKVSSPTRMQCLAWGSTVPWLVEVARGPVAPASFHPSS